MTDISTHFGMQGPVAELFLENGLCVGSPEPGLFRWTTPVTGTGDFISIMYDADGRIGHDLSEERYLIGRYSDAHDGWVQLVFHLNPQDAVDAVQQLAGFAPLTVDLQIDYRTAQEFAETQPRK